jgi:hypothetical protein
MTTLPSLTIGQVVHYCISNCGTIWVPFMVIQVPQPGVISGHLLTAPDDQLNVDALPPHQKANVVKMDKGRWWVQGATEGEGFGFWRRPPYA